MRTSAAGELDVVALARATMSYSENARLESLWVGVGAFERATMREHFRRHAQQRGGEQTDVFTLERVVSDGDNEALIWDVVRMRAFVAAQPHAGNEMLRADGSFRLPSVITPLADVGEHERMRRISVLDIAVRMRFVALIVVQRCATAGPHGEKLAAAEIAYALRACSHDHFPHFGTILQMPPHLSAECREHAKLLLGNCGDDRCRFARRLGVRDGWPCSNLVGPTLPPTSIRKMRGTAHAVILPVTTSQ